MATDAPSKQPSDPSGFLFAGKVLPTAAGAAGRGGEEGGGSIKEGKIDRREAVGCWREQASQ